MKRSRIVLLSLALLAVLTVSASAQGWGEVRGVVTDATSGEALPGVTVIVHSTDFGTATAVNGTYRMRIPAGTRMLRFSFVGFEPFQDSVRVRNEETTVFNVRLRTSQLSLDEITVEDTRAAPAEAGVVMIDPETVALMPAPMQDGFRILKIQPGVATNNELSNEYSVRGGGFNENLIFIDGFEVYKPFRVRQGEQEGLGLLNPDLATSMTLYTGGFPARYGGKLSSALDVRYVHPDDGPRGAFYASLLDAGFTVKQAALNGRLAGAFGFRKARARRFFGTQELKGEYDPDYTDFQGVVHMKIAPGQDLQLIGLTSRHQFRLEPSSQRTFFGTFQNLQALWTSFSGQEDDIFTTSFVGAKLSSRLGRRIRAEHRGSWFSTDEREQFSVSGSSILYAVDNPFTTDPETGEGLIPQGNTSQSETADNQVIVDMLTAQGRYVWEGRRHAPEVGWMARQLHFNDRLDEETIVGGRLQNGSQVSVIVDSLHDQADLTAHQFAFYVQDAFDVLPTRDRLLLTGGVRTDYYSFNEELTISPRLTARFLWTENLTLNAAVGVYNQAPTYKELRGNPVGQERLDDTINRDLKSQRSLQFVAGMERFIPKTRLYFRAEAYMKWITNLISYDIENVRVVYSGENDAKGYATGFDLQLRGELVPGVESWINYGFLVAREKFLPEFVTPDNEGWRRRPSDQRHTISALIQDYIPGNDTWKLGMRVLWGSGLPYTPPEPGERIGNVDLPEPGPRTAGKYPAYKRFDFGATKILSLPSLVRKGEPIKLFLTAELLNMFDMQNVVSYTQGVEANTGRWFRVPTRLTPRTFNVRARLEF